MYTVLYTSEHLRNTKTFVIYRRRKSEAHLGLALGLASLVTCLLGAVHLLQMLCVRQKMQVLFKE